MSTSVLPPVTMPQLSGGRERARALLAPLKGQLRGQKLRLDCRRLLAGTASFADELVTEALVRGGAVGLVVEYASGDFEGYLHEAARDHGVVDKVTFT